ncbi:DMT family transporter [Tabrizicola soli]|uniref:EamA family transporter n=1 Tax=Tabrizicola soli TaxID=2185115 RepID=A0ABV7DRD7_9RHOB|nr:DMT family transporter [Tabrizicola soli]
MLALSFGLTAALVWAGHDLLARKLTQGAMLLPIMLVVFGAGSLALAPVALALGDWTAMTNGAISVALAYGLAYALAGGALYRAFSLAPVRLVSPVIGAFPMLSLVIAAAQGQPVTAGDWISVVAIVLGIAIVATASREDGPEGYAAPAAVAMGWAGLSAAGFAMSFALGQEAARQGAELPVMLIGRVAALAAILGIALLRRARLAPAPGQAWLLVLMGAFDALALGLVTAAGQLPRAEYASVAASLFGVLTVVLAAWILRERVRPLQWLGVLTVFSGIGGLGLQSLAQGG